MHWAIYECSFRWTATPVVLANYMPTNDGIDVVVASESDCIVVTLRQLSHQPLAEYACRTRHEHGDVGRVEGISLQN